MAWFSYRGYRTDTLGVAVEQMPAFPAPRHRQYGYDVAGRQGTLFVPDNTFTLVSAQTRINAMGMDETALRAWFTLNGDLILSDDPTKCYHAYAMDGMQVERFYTLNGGNYSSYTINFTAQPFRYEVTPTVINPASGASITNPGTWESEPLIRIRGNGDATMTIGGETLTFSGLKTNADFVIDTAAGKAYLDGTGAASMVANKFPVVPTGDSTISYSGLTKCEITPRWRWL